MKFCVSLSWDFSQAKLTHFLALFLAKFGQKNSDFSIKPKADIAVGLRTIYQRHLGLGLFKHVQLSEREELELEPEELGIERDLIEIE